MNKIQQLFETEEMQGFAENNQEVLNEMSEATEQFVGVMHEYVMQNPGVFIDSSPEGIKRNIRIFSEAAMCQFLVEVSESYAPYAKIVKPNVTGMDDYI